MARARTVAVAALNIRVHPHGKGAYDNLVKDAFELRLPLRTRGDQYLILTSAGKQRDDGFVVGTFARFTEIDPDGDWLNFDELEQADDRALEELSIPQSLKPNYKSFYFAFHPEKHLFVFELYYNGVGVSARQMRKFIDELFNQPHLSGRYGYISVDLIADRNSLIEIIGLKQLRTLTITVQRPNPGDTGGSEDREIERRMEKIRARKLRQTFDVIPGESLHPDEEAMKLANLALRNGEVEATGRDENGNAVTRSSLDHPAIEKQKFDPSVLTEQQAFVYVIKSMVDRIGKLFSMET